MPKEGSWRQVPGSQWDEVNFAESSGPLPRLLFRETKCAMHGVIGDLQTSLSLAICVCVCVAGVGGGKQVVVRKLRSYLALLQTNYDIEKVI